MLIVDILKIIGCTILTLAGIAWIIKKMLDNEDYFDG